MKIFKWRIVPITIEDNIKNMIKECNEKQHQVDELVIKINALLERSNHDPEILKP